MTCPNCGSNDYGPVWPECRRNHWRWDLTIHRVCPEVCLDCGHVVEFERPVAAETP